MYIEDLIGFIRHTHCQNLNSGMSPRDKSVLFSMGKQITNSLSLTERQAELALKIFKNNAERYSSIPGFLNLIDNPKYKTPFRVVDTTKTIHIIEHEGRQYIAVKFPFDHKIAKALSDVKSIRRNNNANLFRLSEDNIIKIIDNLRYFDFECDEQISKWYEELKEIDKNLENYIPFVTLIDDQLKIINSNQNAETYFEENQTKEFIPDLFLARRMGLKFSKSIIQKIVETKIDDILKSMLLTVDNRFLLSSEDVTAVGKIADTITSSQSYPALVIIPDDASSDAVIDLWYESFSKKMIKNSEMCVLFRSDSNRNFNQKIKDLRLNNKVDHETKIVFVSYKIPKILYKIGFYPKIVVSSSMYYAHYSVQKIIDSHPMIMYHTNHYRNNLGKNIAKL